MIIIFSLFFKFILQIFHKILELSKTILLLLRNYLKFCNRKCWQFLADCKMLENLTRYLKKIINNYENHKIV